MYKILIFSIIFLQTCFADGWTYGTLHVFGDSHSAFGFTNCKTWKEFTSQPPSKLNSDVIDEFSFYKEIPFSVHWLGPYTMHRLGRDGLDLKAYNVKPNDAVLFLTGEIDCRVHIGRQVYVQNRALEEVIDTLAENYVTLAANDQAKHSIRVVISALPPPAITSYNLLGMDYGNYNPSLPSVPLEERVIYTQLLNQALEKKCEEKGVLFVNTFEGFERSDGTMNHDYSDTGNHIRIEFNFLLKNRVIDALTNF